MKGSVIFGLFLGLISLNTFAYIGPGDYAPDNSRLCGIRIEKIKGSKDDGSYTIKTKGIDNFYFKDIYCGETTTRIFKCLSIPIPPGEEPPDTIRTVCIHYGSGGRICHLAQGDHIYRNGQVIFAVSQTCYRRGRRPDSYIYFQKASRK